MKQAGLTLANFSPSWDWTLLQFSANLVSIDLVSSNWFVRFIFVDLVENIWFDILGSLHFKCLAE